MRSRKIADGTYLRWTINPQPGAGTRPLGPDHQHGRIALHWFDTEGPTPKCGSLQSSTRRYVVCSDITWDLDCASNVGLSTARGAVFLS